MRPAQRARTALLEPPIQAPVAEDVPALRRLDRHGVFAPALVADRARLVRRAQPGAQPELVSSGLAPLEAREAPRLALARAALLRGRRVAF